MRSDYLNDLNVQQREAVEFCDAPQLVIAGAGSGKTRVLTYKIVHLLNRGLKPWNILALTFTNKAAREMRERIMTMVGEETASRLWMGTFHSIFAKILRMNAALVGYKSNFTIYDTADSRSLIKTIVRDLGLDDKKYAPAKVHNEISWAKNELISPESYAADSELYKINRSAGRPEMARIYEAYCDRCHAAVAMDFDDLLYYTYRLLSENPEVCEHYREYFKYVLVDEYQDTNSAQYKIINLLCEGRNDLMVVGDDAQSIYSFRGANIRNILDLNMVYPGLRQFKLEQNYRSTQTIINAAGSLIAKNVNQIEKNVYSRNDHGDRIPVIEAYTDQEEARLVAAGLSSLKMRTKDSWDDFAILYRTNAQSRVLEEALRTRNIPYRIYGGLSFYQRKEVKDAISYFRLVVNPDDDEALKRIINFPARGIGDTTVGKLTACAMENNVSIWTVLNDTDRYNPGFNRGTLAKLGAFTQLISSFHSMQNDPATPPDAYRMVKQIISDTGMMQEFMSKETPENISRRENIEELLAAAKEFVNNRVEQGRDDTGIADMLAEVSLATDQDSDTGEEGPDGITERVTLMTVHAAKGLEFNNIFIVGVEENLFPSALSQETSDNIEEERRLLYVAITRARFHCSMSYARSRFRNGMTSPTRPSRFLADIDQQYLKLNGTSAGRLANSSRSYMPRPTLRSAAGGNPVDLNSLRRNPAPASQPQRPAASRPVQTSAAGNDDVRVHTADEVNVGMEIRHSVFGHGVITAVETASIGPRIVVRFDEGDTRTILLKFAKFAIL